MIGILLICKDASGNGVGKLIAGGKYVVKEFLPDGTRDVDGLIWKWDHVRLEGTPNQNPDPPGLSTAWLLSRFGPLDDGDLTEMRKRHEKPVDNPKEKANV